MCLKLLKKLSDNTTAWKTQMLTEPFVHKLHMLWHCLIICLFQIDMYSCICCYLLDCHLDIVFFYVSGFHRVFDALSKFVQQEAKGTYNMYPHFNCFSSTVCQCYKFIFQTSIIVDKRSLQSSVKNFAKENTLCILKQQILPGIIWMLLYMYVWCTYTHNNQCVNKRGEK